MRPSYLSSKPPKEPPKWAKILILIALLSLVVAALQ
jgi:hypothetical protein